MATMARCRVCEAEFALARLLDDWNCGCPSCGTPLAHDGPTRARLLRKAAAVDRLEAQLVEGLSELATIDSNLELSIAPIVVRFLRDIDWRRQRQHDLSFAQRQVDHIRDALGEWTRRLDDLPSDDAAAQNVALSDEMHELAHRLRKVDDYLDRTPTRSRPSDGSAARAAARSLDEAAENLAAGRGRASELVAALGHASDAITTTSDDPDAPIERTARPLPRLGDDEGDDHVEL